MQPMQSVAIIHPNMPCIVVLSGSLAGLKRLIPPEGLTIGRAADNDVCLDDPLASRYHFSFRFQDGSLVLRDGQTPNGTFVDGIARLEYAPKGGERITCGGTLILFLASDASPESLPITIEDEADRNRNLVTLRADYTVRDEGSILYRNACNILRQIPSSLNAGLGFQEVQARILGFAFEMIPAHRGAILMNGPRVSPDPKDFSSLTCRDRDYDDAIQFPLSRKVLDEVYARGEPCLSNDVVPILCIPIIASGRLRGAIYLEGMPQSRGFEPEHIHFLTALSDAAAVALRLSRQFDSISNELDLIKSASTFKMEMLGESDGIQRVWQQMKKAAADDTASVLIMGETGTGKEGVARGIHEMSVRRDKPLVTFNCANAFEPSLVQSELFGHVKGAYTGAIEARKGKLLQANGGTIFFDEIGDFPPSLQQALLRVLQEREFDHVGSEQTIKVNVRVIAATKVDLEQAVRNGTFRDDLFYRLGVVTIVVPPLRERRDDIPLLVQHFLRMYGSHRPSFSIAPEVMDALFSHHWPGNIRELANVIHGAIVDAESDVIGLENIPQRIRAAQMRQAESATGLIETARRAAEEARIKEIKAGLAKGKKVPEIALDLDVSESYVYRVLRQNK